MTKEEREILEKSYSEKTVKSYEKLKQINKEAPELLEKARRITERIEKEMKEESEA